MALMAYNASGESSKRTSGSSPFTLIVIRITARDNQYNYYRCE